MAKRNWYGRKLAGTSDESFENKSLPNDGESSTDIASETSEANEEVQLSTSVSDDVEMEVDKTEDLTSLEELSGEVAELDEDEAEDASAEVSAPEAPSVESQPESKPVAEPEPVVQEAQLPPPPPPPVEPPTHEEPEEPEAELVSSKNNESVLSKAIGTYRHIAIPVERIAEPARRESQILEFEGFVEPDWHEIIELLERKIEPCDLTSAMVDVSRKRKLWRSIEDSLAKVRVSVTGRLVDRSEFRFKDRIAQDAALSEVKDKLSIWRNGRAKSLAWRFNEQVNEQLELARNLKADAKSRVSPENSYRNDVAHETFGAFTRSTLLPVIFGSYLYSVLVLTDNKFHSFLKYFPFFNQSRTVMAIIVAGFVALSVLAGAWRYTSKVREAQSKFIAAQKNYNDSVILITHASEEEVRLRQQAEHVEPLLRVLANGYSSRWVIDNSLEINVSTNLNTDQLPGCFGFARAVEGSDEQTSKLRDLAVRQVVRPGWRTEIIRKVAEKFGEKSGTSLTFTDLDRDIGVSQFGARDLFLEALQDQELAKRVGRDKLIATVNVIHSDVLRNTETDLRPPVMPTRSNGFEDINATSEWLVDEDRTENWVDFLSAILKEAPPFSYLNLSDTGLHGRINEGKVTSYSVVPSYLLGMEHDSVKAEVVQTEIMAPIDIAVRVDVSEWGSLDSFGIFEPAVHDVEVFTSPIGTSGLRG